MKKCPLANPSGLARSNKPRLGSKFINHNNRDPSDQRGEYVSSWGLTEAQIKPTNNMYVLLVGLLGNGLGLLEGIFLLLETLLVLGGTGLDDLAATLGLVSVLLGFIELKTYF